MTDDSRHEQLPAETRGTTMSRREMLKKAGLAAMGAGLAASVSRGSDPASSHSQSYPSRVNTKSNAREAFDYRLLLGWINDNSNRPLAGKRWPITDIDEQTVND
jgi:hypothetical protein